MVKNVPEMFGCMVFNEEVMAQRLPEDVYSSLRKSVEQGKEIDPSIADTVAGAMKDWAIEKGATHYTHWFQPLTGVTAEKHEAFLTPVGGGKHLRLRLRHGRHSFNALYFSCGQELSAAQQGEVVDVAFGPQINEFRDERTVQMNISDIRPACAAPCELCTEAYQAFTAGQTGAPLAEALLPDRATLGMVWRYLAAAPALQETPVCLCRKIVRWSGAPLSLQKLLICLDIFADVGLVQIQRLQKHILIRIANPQQKADLNASVTMQRLLDMKES